LVSLFYEFSITGVSINDFSQSYDEKIGLQDIQSGAVTGIYDNDVFYDYNSFNDLPQTLNAAQQLLNISVSFSGCGSSDGVNFYVNLTNNTNSPINGTSL
jgi:hypothetical protein